MLGHCTRVPASGQTSRARPHSRSGHHWGPSSEPRHDFPPAQAFRGAGRPCRGASPAQAIHAFGAGRALTFSRAVAEMTLCHTAQPSGVSTVAALCVPPSSRRCMSSRWSGGGSARDGNGSVRGEGGAMLRNARHCSVAAAAGGVQGSSEAEQNEGRCA